MRKFVKGKAVAIYLSLALALTFFLASPAWALCSRVTTWTSGQTLTASALNGEFNNILDNFLSCLSPLTGDLNVNSNDFTNVNSIDLESHALFAEIASGPTTAANQGALYTKDAGQTELFFREESDGDEVQITSYGATVGGPDNALINGDFSVWQRGTSFDSTTTPANNDDTYLADRWILLSDGNDTVDVSRVTGTGVATGFRYGMKALVATANRKFGFVQVVESTDSYKYIGRKVCVSFYVYTATATAIRNVRAAVLSWSSTADTVTSDVVSAWGAEGTNPTLAANWTAENTATNLAITVDTVNYKEICGINIDTASTANIALFIWVDDTDPAANDYITISGVRLGLGAGSAKPSPAGVELAKAKRFFERMSYDTVSAEAIASGFWTDTTNAYAAMHFSEKRTAPTISSSAAATFEVFYKGDVSADGTSVAFALIGKKSAELALTVAAGGTAGDGIIIRRDATDTTFIDLDAEL